MRGNGRVVGAALVSAGVCSALSLGTVPAVAAAKSAVPRAAKPVTRAMPRPAAPATVPTAPAASPTTTAPATGTPATGTPATAPATPGAAGSAPVSVPVTLHAGTPAAPGLTGTFKGVLSGTPASPGSGQVVAYSFTVPSRPSARDLDADVTLAYNPAGEVSGYLIAPGGETTGYASSYLTTGFDASGVPAESPGRQLSLYAASPVPGTWTLILGFASPGPANEPRDPFTGQIRFNDVQANRGALPDSPSVSLTAGKPVTYQIAVHNTGTAAEDVFLDPRLTTLRSYPLQPQDQAAGVNLPLPATADPPEWIVPTMTRSVSVSASASSSVPVTVDFGPFPGGPDGATSAGATSAGATAKAAHAPGTPVTPVTPGLWFTVPSEAATFLGRAVPSPAPTAGTTVSTTMTALTQQFDTSATPSTGDFWPFGVAPLAGSASYDLLTVEPGQTQKISLTVRPAGPAGTVVRGTLYVDDFVDTPQFLSGSQLAALPYAYTIGPANAAAKPQPPRPAAAAGP